MTEPSHFREEIQELLDGRLDPASRAEVEAHLGVCARCRRELAALRWVRDVAARSLPVHDVPPALAAAVSSALDREDQAAREAGRLEAMKPERVRWRRVYFKRAFAASLAAATALGGILLARHFRAQTSLPAAVARDYARFKDGGLALELHTGDPAAMESFFAAGGLRFRTRVFDLTMMDYHLAGGRVHTLAGRPSALFVYHGESHELVLCQMYEGRPSELPARAAVRQHNGIDFRLYRAGGLTIVFWPEGAVMCVLASGGDPEELLQLAFAKAMPAPSGAGPPDEPASPG